MTEPPQPFAIEPGPVRVVIVDDDAGFCAAAETVLARQDHVAVVGCAHDGASAFRLIAALAPDLVLLASKMPLVDGPSAAIETIHGLCPTTKVVVVTGSDDDSVARAARSAGAAAFLRKDAKLFENLDLAISLVSVSAASFPTQPWSG